MLLQIFKTFLALPLIFNELLKFLSILHQTHSNSLSFWNLHGVYTRYIPIFSYWLDPVQHIYGSLTLDAFQLQCEMIQVELECRQCSLLLLDCVKCDTVCVPTLSRASHLLWNVSSVTWNAYSVIWNASSVNTIHVPVKRRIGMCLV